MDANSTWYIATAIGSWLIGLSFVFKYYSRKEKRRAMELDTTRRALSAHYDALDAIVGDPALPTSALEFLDAFGDLLSAQEKCQPTVDYLFSMTAAEATSLKTPKWQEEIDVLAKTRPELVENFHKAVANGIIAIFLRWPGNAWKLQELMQRIAEDRRREAAFAEELRRRHNRDRNHKNGGPMISGGLVPA